MVATVDFSHTPMVLILMWQCFRATMMKSSSAGWWHNDGDDDDGVVVSRMMARWWRWATMVHGDGDDDEVVRAGWGIEANCCSKDTAFLKRFQELCERKDLSRDRLLQDCCSKSTAFLTRFNFLVAYYYKIVVQKALLSWQDLHNLRSESTIFLELCERDLSCGISLQYCCSNSTAFLTRFDFLLAYYYKIVVQKALLSCQDLQNLGFIDWSMHNIRFSS